MRAGRTGAVAVALAIAIGAGAMTDARAGGGSTPTDITLKVKGAKFKGRVSSSADDCVVGRKVILFRKDPGGATKLDKTFASESGKYSITVPMQNGNKLFSKVKPYNSPLLTRCAGAKSNKVTG